MQKDLRGGRSAKAFAEYYDGDPEQSDGISGHYVARIMDSQVYPGKADEKNDDKRGNGDRQFQPHIRKMPCDDPRYYSVEAKRGESVAAWKTV